MKLKNSISLLCLLFIFSSNRTKGAEDASVEKLPQRNCIDSIVAPNLVQKQPALVVSITNQTLSGLPTINGIEPGANNRILLIGQTNAIENGLWLIQTGAWTRPADFASGNLAQESYVAILMHPSSSIAASEWICTTPSAIIGTDPIIFQPCVGDTLITGANVGSGSGTVFKNKTYATLNFKTIATGAHAVIANNTNDITISTDATDSNTPNTIVARDGSGNFSAGTITASVVGAASLNVLKSGDTMSGALTVPAGTAASPSIKFSGSTNTGISAPAANTVSLSTNGNERLGISSTGEITIDSFTVPGVVHNAASGVLSSALIVNADVDSAAAIADTKLSTIATAGKVSNSATSATSSNTVNTIVLRDGSGNFNANNISASLTGAASLNVLKSGDTMTGGLIIPAGSAAAPSIKFSGSSNTGISAATADTLSFDTAGVERVKIDVNNVIATVPLVNSNTTCNRALQAVTPVNSGSVTSLSTTSILVLNNNASNVTNFTVIFPPNPANGQLFTILVANTHSVGLINVAGTGGAAIVNAITSLNPGSAPSATANGTSVTYIYLTSANSWYRFQRG